MSLGLKHYIALKIIFGNTQIAYKMQLESDNRVMDHNFVIIHGKRGDGKTGARYMVGRQHA